MQVISFEKRYEANNNLKETLSTGSILISPKVHVQTLVIEPETQLQSQEMRHFVDNWRNKTCAKSIVNYGHHTMVTMFNLFLHNYHIIIVK